MPSSIIDRLLNPTYGTVTNQRFGAGRVARFVFGPQPGRIVAVAGEDLMPGLIVIGKRPAFQNGQF